MTAFKEQSSKCSFPGERLRESLRGIDVMRAACRILEGEVSRFFVELEPQSCKSCSGLNIVINKVKKDNEQEKKRGLGEPPHFEFVEKSRSCPNWSVGGCIFLRYTNETPIFRLRRT